MSRAERFQQPIEDIEIISRVEEPRHLLTKEQIEEAQRRVAQGEDIETVTEELALKKIAEEE